MLYERDMFNFHNFKICAYKRQKRLGVMAAKSQFQSRKIKAIIWLQCPTFRKKCKTFIFSFEWQSLSRENKMFSSLLNDHQKICQYIDAEILAKIQSCAVNWATIEMTKNLFVHAEQLFCTLRFSSLPLFPIWELKVLSITHCIG